MRKQVIAIDLDDTVAECLHDWIDAINEGEGENVAYADVKGWGVHKYFKCGHKVYSYLTHDLFRNLRVKPDAIEVIRKLHTNYVIYFVSSAIDVPQSLVAKVQWVEEHFPFIPIENLMLCGDKSIVRADIMIDDGLHNLENFKGMRILMDASHNHGDSRFIRVHGWREIEKLLLEVI